MGAGFFRKHAAALCLAAIAVCLVVTRACLQNITLDEAGSYLLFASKDYSLSQWYPSSGNHVLNSLLMRPATMVFGISDLTVRIPAILGAVIYIGSALYLCLVISGRKLLQLALLICLIYNPLILDYLVAARGYSLAMGFLLAALALIANIMIAGDNRVQAAVCSKCAWASAFLALSFAANFSFAIADGTTMMLFFLWLAGQQRRAGRAGNLRLAVSCFLPGLLVAFVICGSVVLEWPNGQLYFGSQSLSEMWKGLSEATFDDLNPNVVNPLLLGGLNRVRPALPYITVITVLSILAIVEIGRWRSRRGLAEAPIRRVLASLLDVKVILGCVDRDPQAANDPQTDRLLAFMRLLVAIALTTLLLHWLAFDLVQLLLPKGRTALFFVILWTLAFGGALAVRLRRAHGDFAGSWALGVLIAVAVYFFGCLRLGYFKEWKFDMDTKQVYWVLDDLRRRCGITDFGTDWRYHLSMNFYREAYGNTSLKEFDAPSEQLPPGKGAYAVFLPSSGEFVRQQGLRLIYRNDDSGSGVAIRSCPAEPAPGDH